MIDDDFRAAVAEVGAEPPWALLIRAVSGGVDVHVLAGLTSEQLSEPWGDLLPLIGTLEQPPARSLALPHP